MKDLQSLENQNKVKEKKLKLNIEKLVYGGYGIARQGRKVFMVRYAAPREIVEADLLEEKKDYSYAQVKRVILPSPVRREAICPYFGICGGCQLQHIDYPSQIKIKKEILIESLKRLGGVENLPDIESISSEYELRYRIRVQFKVHSGKLGFFKTGEREVVDIEECVISHNRINELIKPLKECSRYIKELKEIHVTYSPTEDKFLVKFVAPVEIERELLKALKEDFLPPEVVGIGSYSKLRTVLNRRYWIGQEHLYMKVDKWLYRVSGDSFFQVNFTLWESFIKAVVSPLSFRKALDLHCGVGFFTIPLSERGNFIEGSDTNSYAINDAQYNTKINNRDNVIFVKADALRHLKSRAGEVLDLVVMDPPRSGLEEGEIEVLVKNKPDRIVYISCNPTTLARDLKILLKNGYVLEKLKLIDMFPQTYHIESISFLRLK